jgi:hypothetical protein
MLTRSHLTLATALAIAALAAPAATAMPADPNRGAAGSDARQSDMHAGTVTPQDARGENAASLADDSAPVADLRSPDAVEPFARPVVVEVDGEPASPGFDWTAAIVGLAGGLAFAVLAGAAVSGGRRLRSRPHTA